MTSGDAAVGLSSARWNVVVLQEQSQIPSNRGGEGVEAFRDTQMYPAARQLVAMARAAGAAPIFFLTWAHRDGWPHNGMLGYSSMQAAVDDGYLAVAAEQQSAIAPVGNAWMSVLEQAPSKPLWQTDGVHPTPEGTYLAACVFYATVFARSPRGLS